MGPKNDIKRQDKMYKKNRSRTSDAPNISDMTWNPKMDTPIEVDKKFLREYIGIVFGDMKRDKRLSIRQKTLLISIFCSKGILTQACFDAKVPLQTHYSWLKDNPLYKEYVGMVDHYVMDLFEMVLLNKAEGGNMEALKMVLNAKAAERGYSKDSVTNNIIVPTQFNVNFVKPGELGPSDAQVNLPAPPEFTEFTEES